jgi:methionine-rich copper-binding protein CopC
VNGALVRRSGAAALLTIGIVGQASSHAHLRSAVPPADSTVTASPSELDLRFSDEIDLAFTGVMVSGPSGKPVATGPARSGTPDASSLTVPISGKLTAGAYVVDWHALSADGHKTQGRYVFSVQP